MPSAGNAVRATWEGLTNLVCELYPDIEPAVRAVAEELHAAAFTDLEAECVSSTCQCLPNACLSNA